MELIASRAEEAEQAKTPSRIRRPMLSIAVICEGSRAVTLVFMSDNRVARIDSLKRYISLLEKEEKRLRWVVSSNAATQSVRVQANDDLVRILEKITKARAELRDLEPDPRPF